MHSDFDHIGHDRPHKKNKKGPSQLSLNEVKQLIELFDSTPSIGEMSWKGFNIKRPTSVATAAPFMQAPVTQAAPIAPASEIAINTSASKPEPALGNTVDSPMVGTCYLASSPDADNFVEVGQKVKAGDTLCLIEAMKMFNKIKADTSGTITKKLIDDGQAVEFGQPLFEIDDSGV